MSDTAATLESLLDWWRMMGVSSPEAEAILAAPAPTRVADRARAPEAPPRTARTAARPQPNETGAVVEDARAAAASAETFEQLLAALRAFEGLKELRRGARGPVLVDGVIGAPVLVIGEAPGREEDEAGKPFVGPSGRLLDRMLGAIGFSRTENVAITNVVFWRPGANRPPSQSEIAACLPFLERAIVLSQPRLVLLAGGFAAQSVLKRSDGVMSLRGKRLTASVPGLTAPLHAMVMLHPAYVLRRPHDKRLAWRDLLAFAAWADELSVPRGKGL